MTSKNLSDLQYFLLDMDGTVYLGPKAIDGAQAFIAYLKETGRRYLFFTNNPSADAQQYSEKLCRMGIPAEPEDVLTSGEATARYLVSETTYRRVYVLGTPSFEGELERAGISPSDDEPEAVVLAFDKTLTYAKLERACLLLREGLPYIATNPDRVCPTEYGYIPDCGAMAALLEAATREGTSPEGRVPTYIGKPNAAMARMGMAKIGAEAARTAMVGDRLYTDMEMAHRAGIASVLVLSGETTEDALAEAEHPPDFVFDSVKALHKALAGASSE